MNGWAALGVVAVLSVATYAMRAVAVVALAGRTLPVAVERALRSVGPAVLAALAVNLAAGGADGPRLAPAEAAALAVAGLVAWWRKSVIWTLIAGMATLWLVGWAV